MRRGRGGLITSWGRWMRGLEGCGEEGMEMRGEGRDAGNGMR